MQDQQQDGVMEVFVALLAEQASNGDLPDTWIDALRFELEDLDDLE